MRSEVTQEQVDPVPTPPEEPTDDGSERGKKLKKAYSNATSRLRQDHRDDFDKLMSEEAQNLGVEYTPRLTPEERAKKELEEILEQFPSLRDQINPGPEAA